MKSRPMSFHRFLTALKLSYFSLRSIRAILFKFLLFLILISVFTPRLVLAQKHERPVPCDTDVSGTNQKLHLGYGPGVMDPLK